MGRWLRTHRDPSTSRHHERLYNLSARSGLIRDAVPVADPLVDGVQVHRSASVWVSAARRRYPAMLTSRAKHQWCVISTNDLSRDGNAATIPRPARPHGSGLPRRMPSSRRDTPSRPFHGELKWLGRWRRPPQQLKHHGSDEPARHLTPLHSSIVGHGARIRRVPQANPLWDGASVVRKRPLRDGPLSIRAQGPIGQVASPYVVPLAATLEGTRVRRVI